MMCGAPSATQPATAETQHIADQVRSQLEEKENKKFPVFKAVSFKSQVVAGTNYFIKVECGPREGLPRTGAGRKPPVQARAVWS
ncbi:CSTB isoform 3 [Pan troglodytes]|uniref:Cystatin-B n=1 Tax=Pan troglodytes TaxID=9598 RepID=A0A2J8M8F8_PANTR|nr:CSTB isoform 3 [Pan troglodytes]